MYRWLSTTYFLEVGFNGQNCQMEGIIFLHSMSSQRMLMSPTNLHRYGHKCARLGDTVVIAGGADERGDYVPSTMVLDLVTKQV